MGLRALMPITGDRFFDNLSFTVVEKYSFASKEINMHTLYERELVQRDRFDSQLEQVFRLEDNESRAMDQNPPNVL